MADAVIEANQGEQGEILAESESAADDSLEGNEFAPDKEDLDERQF